jgi:hypothetical protein
VYHLSDFRHEKAEKLSGESHSYKVTGQTKIEGEKHLFECKIEDRHVTSIAYDGPEPEGMGTAEKLAVGAAAAVAAGLIASELTEDDEDKPSEASSTHAATSHASSTRAANPSFDCAKASHRTFRTLARSSGWVFLYRNFAGHWDQILSRYALAGRLRQVEPTDFLQWGENRWRYRLKGKEQVHKRSRWVGSITCRSLPTLRGA